MAYKAYKVLPLQSLTEPHYIAADILQRAFLMLLNETRFLFSPPQILQHSSTPPLQRAVGLQ